jgi:hypothetical protein
VRKVGSVGSGVRMVGACVGRLLPLMNGCAALLLRSQQLSTGRTRNILKARELSTGELTSVSISTEQTFAKLFPRISGRFPIFLLLTLADNEAK